MVKFVRWCGKCWGFVHALALTMGSTAVTCLLAWILMNMEVFKQAEHSPEPTIIPVLWSIMLFLCNERYLYKLTVAGADLTRPIQEALECTDREVISKSIEMLLYSVDHRYGGRDQRIGRPWCRKKKFSLRAFCTKLETLREELRSNPAECQLIDLDKAKQQIREALRDLPARKGSIPSLGGILCRMQHPREENFLMGCGMSIPVAV